jgi:putative effector of murein hydrolase
MKTLAALILLTGTATFAFGAAAVPEIDANSAAAAIALVMGGLLVMRARREK